MDITSFSRVLQVYMVMELCQGGELFDRIAECGSAECGGLEEEDAKRYFVQILHALAHCHENRVFHRDLKPENMCACGLWSWGHEMWVYVRMAQACG